MFYVYLFLDENQKPYYVGKGCHYRYKHYSKVHREVKRPADDSSKCEEGLSALAFTQEVKLTPKRQCDGGILVNMLRRSRSSASNTIPTDPHR